ncbi:hypothetical protein H0H81_005755, partial [Sphagnurus paluster]
MHSRHTLKEIFSQWEGHYSKELTSEFLVKRALGMSMVSDDLEDYITRRKWGCTLMSSKGPTVWRTTTLTQGSQEVKDYKESKSFLGFTEGYDRQMVRDGSWLQADERVRLRTEGIRTARITKTFSRTET